MASIEGVHRYTKTGRHLTEAQRQFYEDNGYLIVRKLISDELIDECEQRFLDICNKRIEPPKKILLMRDFTLMKTGARGVDLCFKVNDILEDDVLFKYASDHKIVNIISSIIGEEITATHSMVFNKPPHSTSDDSRHPLHQDVYYFPFGPADKAVAAWTAMQRVDQTNGCLFAIPGSHKWKLYPHAYPDNVKNPGFHGVIGFNDIPVTDFIMEKGDTVFFHPVLLHGSYPNRSNTFRRALSVHYADTNVEFINVAGTNQENVAKEVEQIYAKKGLHLNYQVYVVEDRESHFIFLGHLEAQITADIRSARKFPEIFQSFMKSKLNDIE